MANVKKCDHCGTYYDKSSEGYSYVRLDNRYWNEHQYNVIDLCPECMDILESWLRGGVAFVPAEEKRSQK